jgi:hypothetical protein
MWFYTWQDCDMIYATRNKETYCAQPFADCDAFPESKGLHEKLSEMAEAYAMFQSNSKEWQTEYARGHCKLNDLGARWSTASKGGVRHPRLLAAPYPPLPCFLMSVLGIADLYFPAHSLARSVQ